MTAAQARPAGGTPAGRPAPTAAGIADDLYANKFTWANERQLQDGIEEVLTQAGYAFVREARIGPVDRIDFLVGRVGVEVKIKGQAAAVTRQLTRYAASEQVDQLLLVTTRVVHDGVPRMIHSVPVVVLTLFGGI